MSKIRTRDHPSWECRQPNTANCSVSTGWIPLEDKVLSLAIMENFMSFKNFGDAAPSSGGNPSTNYPIARQSSIYSLTFDKLQNSLGGPGKELGSMNMEDFLKNIWMAEENQPMASSTSGADGSIQGGDLQRQASLTLPRTLSKKTVDEVWQDVLKETIGMRDEQGGWNSNEGQSEPTLGEMTLEDFLFKVGVVKEDNQPSGMPSSVSICGGLLPPRAEDDSLKIGFQPPSHDKGLDNHFIACNNRFLNSHDLRFNVSCERSSQPQQSQLQSVSGKPTLMCFSCPSLLGNNTQLLNSGTNNLVPRKGKLGNTSIIQDGPVNGGSHHAVVVAGKCPGNHQNSDTFVKSSKETLSLSPYNFGEGGRGRRSSTSLEKVAERRQRRMIKNRESASRSRARKQAYTLELEAEVTKLREMNQELRKKQEEFVELQKTHMLETTNTSCRSKTRCLRRTMTGPW